MADKDWSKESVGFLADDSSKVFLLDSSQIEQISVSIGGQPNIDFLPSYGGYYAIVEKDSNLFLEPVENKVDTWVPDAKYRTGDLVKWGGEYFRAKSDLELGDDFSNLNWENVSKDSISNTFTLTDKKEVAYWEAANDGILNILPSLNVDSWKQIDPNGFSSNVSTHKMRLI